MNVGPSSMMLEDGMEIHVQGTRRRPQPEEGHLSLVFEDEWIAVFDKPPGVVVHPTYKNTTGTLLNAVLWRYRDRTDVRPGILTRLDKDTSGLVVVALTPAVHAAMQRDMNSGLISKHYLAAVRGVPEPRAGRVALPLARDAADRRRVVVSPAGAACDTRYELLAEDGGAAILRCEPITGRTHQIRVHLASIGCPIIGDAVYGSVDPRISRQALHAWRVRMPHPVTRDTTVFEAPPPDDLGRLIQNFTG